MRPGTIRAEGETNLATMKGDHAPVPALLLCGGALEDRNAAITRLVNPAAQGRPIAVLRAGIGVFAGPDESFGPHVVTKRAPMGCLCCTAAVMFRVALFELLRKTRPARLVVDLGQGAHVATLEGQLQGESLARAVRVVGRVDLDATRASHAAGWPR